MFMVLLATAVQGRENHPVRWNPCHAPTCPAPPLPFRCRRQPPPPTTAAAGLDCGLSPPRVTCIQLQPTGKILKRILRSSRELAATKLAAILEAVIVENDVTTWMRLLNFPGRCLRVPMRGGRRCSLARQVNH